MRSRCRTQLVLSAGRINILHLKLICRFEIASSTRVHTGYTSSYGELHSSTSLNRCFHNFAKLAGNEWSRAQGVEEWKDLI